MKTTLEEINCKPICSTYVVLYQGRVTQVICPNLLPGGVCAYQNSACHIEVTVFVPPGSQVLSDGSKP